MELAVATAEREEASAGSVDLAGDSSSRTGRRAEMGRRSEELLGSEERAAFKPYQICPRILAARNEKSKWAMVSLNTGAPSEGAEKRILRGHKEQSCKS
uniref:Uncharacterized protein n=1 Tax=Oryza brachyantha TaxID=4533 RepID=J3MB53_ORYBR